MDYFYLGVFQGWDTAHLDSCKMPIICIPTTSKKLGYRKLYANLLVAVKIKITSTIAVVCELRGVGRYTNFSDKTKK